MSSNAVPDGWDCFDDGSSSEIDNEGNELCRAFAQCFKGADGDRVLTHLRQTMLDRRLGPNATDAELRFVEGQRSVVAHIMSMLARG